MVHTDGKGVERIDETGLWVDGEHYEVDCIIHSTGFEVGTPTEERTGFDPIGKGGHKLSAAWSDGMRTRMAGSDANPRSPEIDGLGFMTFCSFPVTGRL